MKTATENVALGKPFFITFVVALVVSGALVFTSLRRTAVTTTSSIFCTLAAGGSSGDSAEMTPLQMLSIVHYATSAVVPQQSRREISVTFDVLKNLYPCNFLVFGLGYDSVMWSSLNPRGTTLFLEEDIRWVHRVLKEAPSLRVHPVRYATRLSDADQLLATYRFEPHCLPPHVRLHGETRCKLALSNLPDDVYDREWDVILIDGPRGYFPAAPGRMAPIFTAAVMARARTRRGVTHVVLHDVDRKVEKTFAREFLCEKYLVKHVDRLWHFEIPPGEAVAAGDKHHHFC
ncbi:Glucuronoxylan 4-O-methyltransferase [Bertholletia excelsa]